jgi:hypothetical protein
MTQPLSAGHLLVDPADCPVLAALVREGARSFATRRRLSGREADVLMAVELAARDARSAAGTLAVARPVAAAPSWLSIGDTAEALRVRESYVRRLCRAGTLVADRRGPVWLVDPDSVAALVLSRREPA